jgi:hypothetical protein
MRTSLGAMRNASLLFLALTLCAPGPLSLSAQDQGAQIKITTLPPAKAGGPVDMYKIAGTVIGVQQPKDYAVVIYAFAGGQWWVQPFDYQPKTAIKNGRFETVTHGGTIYAALLVKASYTPDTPIQALPTGSPTGEVVAVDSVTGK